MTSSLAVGRVEELGIGGDVCVSFLGPGGGIPDHQHVRLGIGLVSRLRDPCPKAISPLAGILCRQLDAVAEVQAGGPASFAAMRTISLTLGHQDHLTERPRSGIATPESASGFPCSRSGLASGARKP